MRDTAVLEQALGREVAGHIRPWMEQADLANGATLLTEGEPAPCLYVLVEGQLEVRRSGSRDVVLGVLGPGALVGEIGFLDGGPATATLVATTNCHLLEIRHSLLPRLQREAPHVAGHLLHRLAATMAERMGESGGAIRQLTGSTPPKSRRARLRKLLGQLAGVR